jgi:DNA polymerase-3 subunit alpha
MGEGPWHSGRAGRGSGAGSLVAYALTITDVDPLRFSLLFERFLNPDRVSMPDFDIDFCQDRREEVIRYVQEKYGRDQVAQSHHFRNLASPRRAARRGARSGNALRSG